MRIENITHRFHRFGFAFDYDVSVVAFCRTLKEKYGWQEFGFDGESKKWVFTKKEIAKEIVTRYPDVAVDANVDDSLRMERIRTVEDKIRVETALQLKAATDSGFIVKHVKGELYPYQKIGVEFIINAKGRAILAEEMGLGKTLESLAYVAHEGFKRVLVVCPASVKYAWHNEVKRWTHLKPHVITSQSDPKEFQQIDVNIFIINPGILKKFFPILQLMRFDVLIGDEAHEFKSITSQRTKLMRILSVNAPRVVFLSGTPFLNRPNELYTLLDMLEPKRWGSWMDFTRSFCQGHQGRFGWDSSGVSNVEKLKLKIAPLFIRRMKKDVLTELPDKIRTSIPVELDREKQKEYDLAMEDFKRYLKEVKGKHPAQIMKAMQAEKFVRLGELRQITTQGKTSALKELVENIVATGEKVVVFSCYNTPLRELAAEYGERASVIMGDTPILERQRMVDRFQNDPDVKVFLGGIKSAGSGITLTAASNVVFLDFSWTPADHAQAQDRCHRISQKNVVNVYSLYAKGTIDEKMVSLLDMKERIFKRILEEGVQGELEDSTINELLKEIEG